MTRPPEPSLASDWTVRPRVGSTSRACARPAPRPRLAATAAAATLLAGCVLVPATTATYDATCEITSRRVTLEPVQVGVFFGCQGRECGALLVAAGVAALASAVVSGSVAVVGNVVYWLEEQGQCQGLLPRPQPASQAAR